MKALLCKEFGPPESLVIEEVADPTPGPGQIVVDTYAAAVNFPDTLIIENRYQFKPQLPFSPGGEAAGVVSAVGDGVSSPKVGDRVFCSTMVGGFAEKFSCAASSAMPIPDAMSFEVAASLLLTYGTTIYALRDRGRLQAGETLLVLGAAGGVGIAAIDIGKAMGARVIAAASSDEKLAVCKAQGADELINYATEDLKTRAKELTDGKGVDVVYDPVGGDYAEAAIRATGWEGRFLVIGFTAGIPRIPLNLTLLKNCDVRGVFWGAWVARAPAEFLASVQELIAWHASGKIKPLVSATYSLERAPEALRAILDRRATGKLVVLPRGSAN